MTIRRTKGEWAFDTVNVLLMLMLMVVTLYPFLFVLFSSLSDPVELLRFQGVMLYPQGFTLKAYQAVAQDTDIYIGFANTFFYVIVGTALNLFMTTLGAYVLSRKRLMLRKAFTLFTIFTMYFSGGMIPSYLLVKNLHMMDTRLALILPVAINTWNLIIMLTSFNAIPESLEEAARIDGANDWIILFKIIFPVSLPVVMVMILYYAVGHWNSWFSALIYLNDKNLFPLQLFLQKILIQANTALTSGGGDVEAYNISFNIKYAVIIVATVPILLIYPFLQKYFVKGIMVGSIKG